VVWWSRGASGLGTVRQQWAHRERPAVASVVGRAGSVWAAASRIGRIAAWVVGAAGECAVAEAGRQLGGGAGRGRAAAGRDRSVLVAARWEVGGRRPEGPLGASVGGGW
jgi:hypothetical protein